MPYVEVRCPFCSKIGKIRISKTDIKNISRGLLTVNVAAATVCQHSFVAYVDKNLKVRDYFTADFKIELPETELDIALKEKEIPGIDIIDMDLIKLNLTPSLLAYITRAIVFKRKIVLILGHKYLYNHILNLFEYITQNSFKVNLTIISKDEYYSKNEQYNDFIILEGINIINDKDKILDPKNLYVENKLIERFLSESKSTLSLALLKNEIKKTYVLAKSISDFIKSYKQKVKLSSKIITDYLKDAHGFKTQKDHKKYLNWLLEITKEYFGTSMIHDSDVADFLESV